MSQAAAVEQDDGRATDVEDPWRGLEVAVRILRGAAAANASDIHLKVDRIPAVRIEGELCPLEHPPLTAEQVWTAVRGLAAWAKADDGRLDHNQCDFSCVVPDAGRFRVARLPRARQRGLRGPPHPGPRARLFGVAPSAGS